MTSPAVALLLAALASLAWGTQGARPLQADQTFEVANITLEFAAYNNMLDEPLLTVSKASKAGRQLYYEVPQAPVGVLAFFHGARRSWMLAKGVSAAVPGGRALAGSFVWPAGERLARSLHGVSRTVRASRPLVPAELTTRAPWLRPPRRLRPQRLRLVAAPARL